MLNSNDLIVVAGGANDLFSALDENDWNKQIEIAQRSIDATKNVLQGLYDNGARHLIVTNASNLGIIPKFINTAKEDNAVLLSQWYNANWSNVINNFIKKNGDVIKTYDFYSGLSRIRQQFASQNKNITHAAVENSFISLFYKGSTTVTYQNEANKNNLNNYLFMDEVHPTAEVHKIVGQELYQMVKNW